MSTSGLNPTGSLCFGANNTTNVSIGFDDAITIDNTTAEISINGTIYNGSGTQTNFTSLILSNAGFNPSGSLNIGTSNTSEITIGALKIDNTVVPPQLYMNGISLPPSGLTVSGDKFTLQNDVTNGDYSTINNDLIFIASVDNIPNVSVGSGSLNKLAFLNDGIYQITIKISVVNDVIRDGDTQNIFLRALLMDASGAGFTGFYNVDDLTTQPSGNAPIENSDIDFTFSGGDISFELMLEKTFTVGVRNHDEMMAITPARFTIGSGSSDPIYINKIGTEITINRTGDWPTP